jgi:hypothetical protein
MQIGLHPGILSHFGRARAGRHTWRQSEEVRFQFAAATTLVHELAHVFWWWTHSRCGICEGKEPWLSPNQRKIPEGPELGNDWEFWALGSRVPTAGNIRIRRDPHDYEPTNIFSQSDWNYTFETGSGGRSCHECISHQFIFPFKWINDWFREETWQNIDNHGKTAGRPNHDNMVIL